MFKVSAKLEYGLRAMILLGKNYNIERLSLSDIAHSEKISKEFLAQLMLDLRKANLVESYKGVTGGYSLTKHPKEITLKEILEALEGPIQIIECIHETNLCEKQNLCLTKNIWEFVEIKILDLFNEITLQDLITGNIRKEANILL
jgi:Rrf2 family protein